jgi:hypothetical protein
LSRTGRAGRSRGHRPTPGVRCGAAPPRMGRGGAIRPTCCGVRNPREGSAASVLAAPHECPRFDDASSKRGTRCTSAGRSDIGAPGGMSEVAAWLHRLRASPPRHTHHHPRPRCADPRLWPPLTACAQRNRGPPLRAGACLRQRHARAIDHRRLGEHLPGVQIPGAASPPPSGRIARISQQLTHHLRAA